MKALSEQKYFSKFLPLLLETHLTLLIRLHSGHERSKQSANTGNAFSSEIEFLCVGVDGRRDGETNDRMEGRHVPRTQPKMCFTCRKL